VTTRVLVVNYGPESVEVQKVHVTPSGTSSVGDRFTLPATSHREVYVYDGQDLRITERKG